MYVFTTRADTIMGVTFCAVAPEHPLALHAAKSNLRLAAFIEECKAGGTTEAELAVKDKLGMPTGLQVTHPITGDAGGCVGGQLRADGLWRWRRDGGARAR
jgi:leucyl-tRNA synthetase